MEHFLLLTKCSHLILNRFRRRSRGVVASLFHFATFDDASPSRGSGGTPTTEKDLSRCCCCCCYYCLCRMRFQSLLSFSKLSLIICTFWPDGKLSCVLTQRFLLRLKTWPIKSIQRLFYIFPRFLFLVSCFFGADTFLGSDDQNDQTQTNYLMRLFSCYSS